MAEIERVGNNEIDVYSQAQGKVYRIDNFEEKVHLLRNPVDSLRQAFMARCRPVLCARPTRCAPVLGRSNMYVCTCMHAYIHTSYRLYSGVFEHLDIDTYIHRI